MMRDLGAACDLVWPGQVFTRVSPDAPAVISASKPHFTQLLSLVMSRFTEALQGGASVQVSVRTAKESPFADFHLTPASHSGAYIEICERREEQTLGILRGLLRPAESTEYAATLVNMVGGHMMLGVKGVGAGSIHLLLPATAHRKRD